jgi:uncharacterized membrane protein YgcG
MGRRTAVIVTAAALVFLGGGAAVAFALAADAPRAALSAVAGDAPGVKAELGAPGESAGVDDFVVESFAADYELGRDAEGRSTLRTIERIAIVFPEFDQNRGIIRDLVREYDDHPTDIEVISVTDENGQPRAFTTGDYREFLAVTIAVPEGSFVHGTQHYVIEYTQRDVTRGFSDTDADEFYWDVNGFDWKQPFGSLGARVTVADALVPALTGNTACYRGHFGSGDPCEVASEGATISVEERDLTPTENVTVSVGFAPGTFVPYPAPFLEQVPLLLYGGFASLAGAVLLIVGTVVSSLRGRRTGRAIIAHYEPPTGMTTAVAAELLRTTDKAMTATLLDFAVRRRIRLLHDEATGLYGAQALTPDGLELSESTAYFMLFPSADPHETLWFTARSTRLGDAAGGLLTRARATVRSTKLIRRVRAWIFVAVAALLVLALLLPVVHSLVIGDFTLMTVLLAVGLNLIVWVLLFVLGGLAILRPRTREGQLIYEHLMGLREYIRLAEADRIRMLQSASGAEVSQAQIVQVYERLLPYAVLFGFETEWQHELARYYAESTPDWVMGSSNFSTSMPLRGFRTAVAASPATRIRSSGSGSGSRSSFSSSRGGSSGGGFSGGGGGGGGGRGI